MTTPWNIKPLWQGEAVAVLAGGPSMNAAVAAELRKHRCIVVNHAHLRAPWADMLVVLDLNLPLWAAASAFAGMRVCGVSSDLVDALYVGPMYERVAMGTNHNIEIHNSGLAAIRIAAAMGAKSIILAGFDPELAPGRYAGLAQGLAALIAELRGRGIVVERHVAGTGCAPAPERSAAVEKSIARARRRGRVA